MERRGGKWAVCGALATAVLVVTDRASAYPAQDEDKKAVAADEAFAECKAQEKIAPAPACWALFLRRHRDAASEDVIAYAEEHAKVVEPPASAPAPVKPTPEPAPVKPTPEPVPEPPRRALRAPEDEPGKDAPRVFGSESGPGLGSFVLHPKVGLLVTGSGNSDTQYECSGIFRATCPPGDSFTEGTKPGLGLGIDALLHLSPHLRVGLGFLYLTNTKSDENGRTIAWGTDLSLPLLVEGVFDVFAAVRVGVRAEGGPALLFPGGDLQDWLDRREAICADAGVHDVLCHADSGSFFGGVLGGGGFVSYGVGPVRFRADVVLQYFTLDAGGAQIGDGGNEWDMSTSYSGLRLWLLGGVEL